MSYRPECLCALAPLRFLCDEMLRGLGEWLRLAGYNTVMPREGDADGKVLARAIAEERWLITRDRGLAALPGAASYVILLRSHGLQENLAELTARLNLDWMYQPLSRCKNCNTTLVDGVEPLARHRVPGDKIREGELRYCPDCDQFFWEGSHSRRIRSRLQALGKRRP